MTVIMPQERVGVTLGAQVRHVATYRDPLGDPYLHRFYQKVSKPVQKGGYPLFLASKKLAPPSKGSPGLEGSSKSNLCPISAI